MRSYDIVYTIFQKLRVGWKLRKLDIALAGKDDEHPFVELTNGTRFYGLEPVRKDLKYYKVLPRSTRLKLPFSCYKVAMDIVIRYHEGGLKLGGPKKEHYYRVKPGDVVAEMGAYMGYYTIYLAQRIGSTGRVIAIEPMEDNLKFLEKNLQYNGIKNVSIVPHGVWKENDTLVFKRSSGDTQSASLVMYEGDKEEQEMDVRTLDNILSDCGVSKVDFMIIQLNGVEPEAIDGLQSQSPENLAIAARYRTGDNDPVAYIKTQLEKRKYNVRIKSRKYIFAHATES